MKTRLHIDRLVLKTSGLTPTAAMATARALGPAIAEQLNQQASSTGPISSLKVSVPAGTVSPTVIARHVAHQLSAQQSPSS